jgi:predicted TIM-barrel fold metal-dependent hydrolase
MMPIVDALMHLPAGSTCKMSAKESLEDYLAQFTEFHVLRALAVQPTILSTESVAHACCLQTLATTRGSGGLPHGLSAYIALEETADYLLQSHMEQPLHRGVAIHIDNKQRSESDIENTSIVRQCTVLRNTKAVVNIGVTALTQANCSSVFSLLKLCSAVPFVFQIDEIFIAKTAQKQLDGFLYQYSQFDNAHLTIAGMLAPLQDASVEGFTAKISQMIHRFGYGRVMFGSNYPHQTLCGSYDELWRTYSASTTGISATNRDKLFRSNALRLYRLSP